MGVRIPPLAPPNDLPICDPDRPAGRRWAVGEGERIHHRPVLGRKGGQLLDQVALLGLKAGSGVVGDQAGQPLLTLGAKEPCGVDGMEAEPISDGA